MISIKVESFTKCFEEIQPLTVEHWRELALEQDKVPLDPRWDIYLERDHVGDILFVTVREKGKLLGYFVGFVGPGLHYKSCKTLQMDVFWIHPDLRDSDSLSSIEAEVIAEDLFSAVQQEAKRRGVKRIFVGSKMHKDASALFERIGYTEVERYYSLWIGG